MDAKKSNKFTKRIEIKCIISKPVEGNKKEWLKHVQFKDGTKRIMEKVREITKIR